MPSPSMRCASPRCAMSCCSSRPAALRADHRPVRRDRRGTVAGPVQCPVHRAVGGGLPGHPAGTRRSTVVGGPRLLRSVRAQFRRLGRRRHRRPARPDRTARLPQRRRPRRPPTDLGVTALWLMPDRRVAELPRLRRDRLPDGRPRLRHQRRLQGARRRRQGPRHRRHRRPRDEPHLRSSTRGSRTPARPGSAHDDWYVWSDDRSGGQRSGRQPVWHRGRRPLVLRLLLGGDAGPEPARTRRSPPSSTRSRASGSTRWARRASGSTPPATSSRTATDLANTPATFDWLEGFRDATPGGRSRRAARRRGLGRDLDGVALRQRRRARHDLRVRSRRRRSSSAIRLGDAAVARRTIQAEVPRRLPAGRLCHVPHQPRPGPGHRPARSRPGRRAPGRDAAPHLARRPLHLLRGGARACAAASRTSGSGRRCRGTARAEPRFSGVRPRARAVGAVRRRRRDGERRRRRPTTRGRSCRGTGRSSRCGRRIRRCAAGVSSRSTSSSPAVYAYLRHDPASGETIAVVSNLTDDGRAGRRTLRSPAARCAGRRRPRSSSMATRPSAAPRSTPRAASMRGDRPVPAHG